MTWVISIKHYANIFQVEEDKQKVNHIKSNKNRARDN